MIIFIISYKTNKIISVVRVTYLIFVSFFSGINGLLVDKLIEEIKYLFLFKKFLYKS